MPAPGRRRTTKLIAASGALLVGLLAVLPGSGASADTAADQREVKRKKAEVAAQVDTLQATDAQLDAALADLQANVSATQAAMNNAQAQVDAATARAEQAERDAAATQANIEALRAQVVSAAVEAYVDPQGDKALDVFRESSANDASAKQALIDATSGAKLDVVDEFRSEKQRLEDLQAEAETARAEAAAERDALAQKKSGYDTALLQQQQVANQVSARINDKLAESAALSALDSQLSAQLQQEQAALAARVKASSQRQRLAAPAAVAVAAVAVAARSPRSSPGPASPPSVASPWRPRSPASSASLLNAASAAGYTLGGSGYRDSSGQIALRRQNCGTSDYAIYQMPPEQCSPPTAIPGRSKHEQGLAVDFTIDGHTLRTSDGAYRWMVANAASYGFVNLPGEPWHWSVGGG